MHVHGNDKWNPLQRWVIEGMSHERVALSLGASALALTCIALLGWSTGRSLWYWTALAAGTAMTTAEWLLLQRLERRPVVPRPAPPHRKNPSAGLLANIVEPQLADLVRSQA